MKKSSILLAGFAFLAACNSGDKEETAAKMVNSDLVSEYLKGDISVYEETPYKTDSTGKMGEMDSCCISVTEYDEHGNEIKNTSKDSKGTVTSETVITRHANGLFKSAVTTEKGKTTGNIDTRLDENGKYNWAEVLDSNGKLDVYYLAITQDENDNVTGWKQYDRDSVFRQSGESVYDKFMQTSFSVKDNTGKIKSYGTYKYNDKGEQTEMSNTTITKDSTVTKVTKYTYEAHDEMGNWTRRTTWDDKGKATRIAKRVYTYRKKE
jgi:hypothetical protein